MMLRPRGQSDWSGQDPSESLAFRPPKTKSTSLDLKKKRDGEVSLSFDCSLARGGGGGARGGCNGKL